MLELIFLGTSAGVPSLKRNVSGLAVKHADRRHWLLVDCGEGTQHQLLRTSLSLIQLEAVLITHVHGDHTYGLPGLLATAAMAGRRAPLTIIAPAGVAEYLRSTMQYTDMYLGYELEFVAAESLDSIDIAGEFSVQTAALSHRVPSYAYCIDEKSPVFHLDVTKLREDGIPQGPLWGAIARGERVCINDREIDPAAYRLPGERAQRIVVGGDNDKPELLRDHVMTADVLVHEATYTEAISRKVGPRPQHSSAAAVALFAREVGVPNLVLTHFSARYHHHERRDKQESLADLRQEAESCYTGRLFLAEDLQHYRLQRDRALVLLNS